MATVTMTSGTANHVAGSPINYVPYFVEKVVDFAAAATAKGSALAAADVIEVLQVPAQTLVLWAGIEKTSASTGTSTDLTLDLGITGVDADAFVDGIDWDAAAVGDYGAVPAATIGGKYLVGATADTIDILIATQTGTFTGGKARVWALLVNVDGKDDPGIARAGS